MKYCQKCGKQNEDEAAFCISCGNRFDQETVTEKSTSDPGLTPNENKDGLPVGFYIFLLIAIIFIAIVIRKTATTQTKQTTQPDVSYYYKVNKSTGLYESYEVDSEMIEILSVGDKLEIPGGSSYPTCVSFEDPIVSTMELCYLYSPKHSKHGWVLLKWLDRRSN